MNWLKSLWNKIKGGVKTVVTPSVPQISPVVVSSPQPAYPELPTDPSMKPVIPLAWETAMSDGQMAQGVHPERAPWSALLYQLIFQNQTAWFNCVDIRRVLPRFDKMSVAQRVSALAELMCRVAEYESDWNPGSKDTDVNGSAAPEMLARGFYQLNVPDQSSFHTGTNYTYRELNDPLKNIRAGIGIMNCTIKANNSITWTKGAGQKFFFETLGFNVKYQNIDKILVHVDNYCKKMGV